MIEILKSSSTIEATPQENEFVLEQTATVRVQDDVSLSQTAQTVADVQAAIEEYEETSDVQGPLTPSEAAVKIVTEQFGIPESDKETPVRAKVIPTAPESGRNNKTY